MHNQDCTATRLTISNPPINLWTAQLIYEFNTYLLSLNNTHASTPKIIVISSDLPDFYISHLDLHLLSAAHPVAPPINAKDALNTYFENLTLLQSLPVIFVAEINGRTWGAGDEHLMQMDMRFAGPGAFFGAPEAALGVFHVNATEAARVGWVHFAFATVEGLREYVDGLVRRIAKFEGDAIRATKRSVARQKPTMAMFEEDQAAFAAFAAEPAVRGRAERFLEISRDQGRVWELDDGDNIVEYMYGV
ncbi:hypothetical protein HYALB_00012125 [Hymenoscyphus albidus]|uniref:Uncharacterized protein n=1 Tax=Hymenoscyphus albidus TaxID=595503 RepID=A0A9N9LT25_9HELO|nr:hypothetical protein HYALB_00012125 [Hymenoscyphus albidus]